MTSYHEDIIIKIDGILHSLREGCGNSAKARLKELRGMLEAHSSMEISQLIPAPGGLFAKYRIDGDSFKYSCVHCFALTDDGNVRAMISAGSNMDRLTFAADAKFGSFQGLVYPVSRGAFDWSDDFYMHNGIRYER